VNVRHLLEELAAEHGLCWRALAWRKRGGPCSRAKCEVPRRLLRRWETPEQHHLRLATALAAQRLRDWPWEGRIVVRERSGDGSRDDVHVFDRWCHVGTARDEDELAGLLRARVEIAFDPDIYKILVSFVARHPGAVKCVPWRALEDDAVAA
jgi:DNA polymerase-3 subunit epsilon